MAHTLSESLALAGVVVGRVTKGESLTRAMAELRAEGPLRAAVQSLTYAALRDYGRGDALVRELVQRPPTPSLQGLLLAALTELQHGPQSTHAVVHQAVEAAARVAPRSAQAAKGLVNGVLRNWLRQRDELNTKILATEVGTYRYPQWWIDRVRSAWPSHWQTMLEAGNAEPPMTLRVNRRHASGADYLERCRAQGIDGAQLGEQALRLAKPCPVDRLPGFAEGHVSVQDWAAQQAAQLLDVRPQMKVLDACAAPGGKTAHIAELADCDLTAVDSDAVRLERVRDNLRRLGLSARIQCADAASQQADIGAGYERILLDAPCSASGVVRRHPDIKWLRRPSDIGDPGDVGDQGPFVRQQSALLAALWQRLAPGGRLLYATCSVFPEENTRRIEAFLASHADAAILPLTLPAAMPSAANADNIGAVVHQAPGCQIFPGPDTDGFYYALLEKKA